MTALAQNCEPSLRRRQPTSSMRPASSASRSSAAGLPAWASLGEKNSENDRPTISLLS